jgi:hypothetical protein
MEAGQAGDAFEHGECSMNSGDDPSPSVFHQEQSATLVVAQ